MPTPSRSLVAAALLVTLVATACSSGSKPTGAPSTSASAPTAATSAAQSTGATSAASSSAAQPTGSADACSLAAAADVTGVYGEQFGGANASSPGGYSSCLFPPPTGGIDSVSFTVATGSQADLFYTSNRSAYQSTDVANLADKAFVSNDGGALGIEKGGTAILIHVVGFENVAPAALQAKQEAFAKVLLSHLS